MSSKLLDVAKHIQKYAVSEGLMERALRLMVAGGRSKEEALNILVDDGVPKEDAYLAVMSANFRYEDLMKHRKEQEKYHIQSDPDLEGLGSMERTNTFIRLATSKKQVRRAINLLNFGRSPEDAVARMVEKGATEEAAKDAVEQALALLNNVETSTEPASEAPMEESTEPDLSLFHEFMADEPEEQTESEPSQQEWKDDVEGEWGTGPYRDIMVANVCDSLLKKLAKTKETSRKSVDKSLQKVKKDYAGYKSEFDKLENEKKKLDSKLDSLKEKLDKAKDSYLELSEDSKNMDIHNAEGCGSRKGPDGKHVKFYTKDGTQYVVDESNSLKSLKDLFSEIRAKKHEEADSEGSLPVLAFNRNRVKLANSPEEDRNLVENTHQDYLECIQGMKDSIGDATPTHQFKMLAVRLADADARMMRELEDGRTRNAARVALQIQDLCDAIEDLGRQAAKEEITTIREVASEKSGLSKVASSPEFEGALNDLMKYLSGMEPAFAKARSSTDDPIKQITLTGMWQDWINFKDSNWKDLFYKLQKDEISAAAELKFKSKLLGDL